MWGMLVNDDKQVKEEFFCPKGIERSKQNLLASVVEELCHTNTRMVQRMCEKGSDQALPSRAIIIEIIETLRTILFPGYFGTSELDICSIRFHVGSNLDRIFRTMKTQILRGLCFFCPNNTLHCQECKERALLITNTFIAGLVDVQKLLNTDVQATYEGDPAAISTDETIFCYPGILALTNYRIAHELYKLEVPLIPRMITEHAHSITGIDIHPGAEIGEGLCMDHGTGIVIGETCVIGNKVRIYQGVTLGAKSFPLDEKGLPIKGIPRHPIVEDDVIIYSGATILGRVKIGKGSIIGGNVWLTQSVPPGSHVLQSGVRYEKYNDGGGI